MALELDDEDATRGYVAATSTLRHGLAAAYACLDEFDVRCSRNALDSAIREGA